ncbi:MAG: hypothetical protein KDA91_14830 [Planctomycetaceae bacterium]|nr:hypothetical protein [Planctomycetaceae bacterium]
MAKSKASDPAIELSKAMCEVLQRVAGGEHYPCTLRHLADGVRTDISDEEILAAVGKNPLKKDALTAFPGDPESLVALKADKERLAADDRTLKELLSRLCSPELPYVSIDSLKALLTSTLRTAFVKEWKRRIKERNLPTFAGFVLVKSSSGKGKVQEELHDLRFPLSWVVLSEKLVAALRDLKANEPHSYPTTFSELCARGSGVDSASEGLVRQAINSEPFCSAVRSIRNDGTTEWFAFSDDAYRVVTQDSFLEKMIHAVCTPEDPETKLSILKKQLPKDLQNVFADHWLSVAGRNESRVFFEIVKATKKDLTFRDVRFPKPEAVLSEKLVAALRDLKANEPASYPTTFSRLCARVGPEAGILMAGRAASLAPYSAEVITAFPAAVDSPIGLAEDLQQIAESSLLLPLLLPKHIKPEHQAVPVATLAKTKGLHVAVQPFIEAAIERMIEDKSLPPALGALRISRKWNLFFQKDVRSRVDRSSMPDKAEAVRNSFSADFDEAFNTANRTSSIPGCVSLADLRRLLDDRYPRAVFDEELLRLRKAGRYSLSAVEGRFPLTEVERAACLIIDNRPHLLVLRK